MSAPLTTSSASPSSAPASSNAASGMLAPSPAPRSMATAAPRAMNLRTVSGVTATRLSPAARSCKTAMRIPPRSGSGNQKDDDEHQQRGDRDGPFEKADEPAVGLRVGLPLLCRIQRGLSRMAGASAWRSTAGRRYAPPLREPLNRLFAPVCERPPADGAAWMGRMADAEQRLLMLIDDEPAQSRLITALAAREGWRTLVVRDSETAIATLGTRQGMQLSAIILDQWVPGDQACELIRELKDRRPALPILMLTTSTSPLLAVEAMRAGATDYLVKPVAPDRLMQAL